MVVHRDKKIVIYKMLFKALLCVACFGVVTVLANEEDVVESKVVVIESGAVRGYKNQDAGIYEFRNIPYATAPKGKDKFKAPRGPPVWHDTFDAVDRSIICPQNPFLQFKQNQTVQEDCLVASVYVPDTEDTNLLPVVVFIHGGAFQMGFGDWLIPRALVAEHNIIAVTFNYRLGAHGFLCLGTEAIPGNAGLKDQVALLKWVKKNIESFGGKPGDVTIGGYSAGATSVDLLMLSKAADGLFKRVIADSGANNAAAAIQPKPLMVAKWLAKSLNFTNGDDIVALELFYTSATFDKLTADPFLSRMDSTFGFTPCVEQRLPNSPEGIIYESPVKILEKGDYKKVPLLYGFTNMEGLLRIDYFDLWKDKMNEDFTQFLPADLKFANKEQKQGVAGVVKRFYFGDKPVSNKTVIPYVDYFTDVIFAYPMIKAVKLGVESGNNQIYLYEYSFTDENTPMVPHTDVRGANHCTQTQAVFGGRIEGFTPEYIEMSSKLRQLWANFIKTGSPVPEGSSLPPWPPVSKGWSPHMSINNDLQLGESLRLSRMEFWEEIYSKYYRHPIAPKAKTKKRTEL